MTAWAPTVSCFAVVAVFFAGVAAVCEGIRRCRLSPRRKAALAAAILLSASVKIALATRGHNYDVDSYRIVAEAVTQGKSVYASTDRYNYGPVWAWTVAGLSRLAGLLNWRAGEGFHVLVAALLALADAGIGLLLSVSYSHIAALVFLLSPIGLLISGFHSQFDNVAVLVALAAWLIIRNGSPGRGRLAGSAALMGVSLVVKHVLFFFPLWLVFWKPLGRFRARVLYAAVAYGLFFGSFIPWLSDPASRTGILQNVFGYKSTYARSFLGLAADLAVSPARIDEALRWVPVVTGFNAVWMVLMVAAGVAAALRKTRELLFAYLFVLYVISPANTDQYTAIPLAACAVLHGAWPVWAYAATATAGLLASGNNVLGAFYLGLPDLHYRGHAISVLCLAQVTRWRLLAASQFCLAALVVARGLAARERRRTPRVRTGLVLALALVAAGGLFSLRGVAQEAYLACRTNTETRR